MIISALISALLYDESPAAAAASPKASSVELRQARPFADTSPWNQVIPPDPKLDPRSELIRGFLSQPSTVYANTENYGVPIFYADASTPKYRIDCTAPWGSCGLEGRDVPIPDQAWPSKGSDGAMVIIDLAQKLSWEFWQAQKLSNGGWTASWGGVISTAGLGVDARAGLPTGAGVPRLAGVIRTHEMQQGRIDHALVFASRNTCKDAFRYPAIKTDGQSIALDCIEQGTRIQLDPSLEVDELPGLSRGERIIAQALQTYGAYAMDVAAGVNAVFIFEAADRGNPYAAFGIDSKSPLSRLPMDRIRVLRSWDGS